MTLEKKVYIMPEPYDHDRVLWTDNKKRQRGAGFIQKYDKDKRHIALTLCPVCEKENRITYILKGQCCFCNFNPNTVQEKKEST